MAKIHTDGAVIDYATRFGPNSEVLGFGIALDAGGAIYVAGWVDSANFPTTPGAFDSSFAEPRDGFVLKFDGALNTPVGSGIIVTPEDSETGTAPVTLGFDQVVQTGATTVTISESAPPLPGGFSVGVPATFYDIATTAVFTGSIEICFNYAAVQFEDEEALVLLHFESGAWADVTTTHDIGTKTICGSVTTLSPFAIAAASLEGSMVGDGAITVSGQEHQFSFQVSERPIGVERGTLKYTLKTPAAGKQRTRIDRFDATAIDSVSFSDMPGGSTGQRPAADSVKFSGNGRWNGVAGYRFETTATDEGESGRGRDRFAITIRDQNGEVVATVDGRLTAGNIQSKP
jgi:hypothetical protein